MPTILNPADLTTAQWNYIVSTLRTESTSGRLSACGWTNAAGSAKTSAINDVRRSHHLFTENQASIGVQLRDWNATVYSTNRRYLVTQFDILIAVQAQTYTSGNNTIPANGDDALAQAWAYVSDGQGNGISEIFRDPANYTLGGNALMTILASGMPMLDVGEGQTPQIWAYVYCTLKAEKLLAIR